MKQIAKPYDAIVIGLGAMGAATLYQLALSGKKVLGIDQYSPPHNLGSSHGDSRITRLAIGEGEEYVPFAIRSHQLWRDIEKKTGKKLLHQVGGLIIGDTASTALQHGKPSFVANTITAAAKFGITHDILDATELRKRFPQFNVADVDTGYYEPDAGFLKPEECIRAQLFLAKKLGADLLLNQKVTDLPNLAGSSPILVKTADCNYQTQQVVVTAGPWARDFIKDKENYFKVYRQVLFWFSPREEDEKFLPGNFPIFIWAFSHSSGNGVYGFPILEAGTGVKLASEQYLETTTAETVSREVSQDEIELMYLNYVKDRFPQLSNKCIKAVSCLYTVTPNSNFVIQRLAINQQVIIASCCSGHGFKHSAAIGEALAELVNTGKSGLDLSKFGFVE